jgi:hypothetical protein
MLWAGGGRKGTRWQRKREKASGAGMDMDLGAVLEDDVGVAGVGERVGDGQVVAPHHADVELPDHLLLGRRRHCARVGGVWWERASELWIGGDKPRRRRRLRRTRGHEGGEEWSALLTGGCCQRLAAGAGFYRRRGLPGG